MKTYLITSRPWALAASIVGVLLWAPAAGGGDQRPAGTVRVAGIVLMQPTAVLELAERGADLVFNPSGGSWGAKSDAIMSRRSRDGGVPVVCVRPVEFLATAADGSILASRLHGTELDDPASQDAGTVGYADLPLDR